jgi:hypothetical protein
MSAARWRTRSSKEFDNGDEFPFSESVRASSVSLRRPNARYGTTHCQPISSTKESNE